MSKPQNVHTVQSYFDEKKNQRTIWEKLKTQTRKLSRKSEIPKNGNLKALLCIFWSQYKRRCTHLRSQKTVRTNTNSSSSK